MRRVLLPIHGVPICVTLAILGLLFDPTAAHATEKCGSLERIMAAIRLTQTLYPSTVGKELSISFSQGTGGPINGPTDAASLRIALDEDVWHANQTTTSEPPVSVKTGPNYLYSLGLAL